MVKEDVRKRTLELVRNDKLRPFIDCLKQAIVDCGYSLEEAMFPNYKGDLNVYRPKYFKDLLKKITPGGAIKTVRLGFERNLI